MTFVNYALTGYMIIGMVCMSYMLLSCFINIRDSIGNFVAQIGVLSVISGGTLYLTDDSIYIPMMVAFATWLYIFSFRFPVTKTLTRDRILGTVMVILPNMVWLILNRGDLV